MDPAGDWMWISKTLTRDFSRFRYLFLRSAPLKFVKGLVGLIEPRLLPGDLLISAHDHIDV
jgi:hypothetical protein